MKKLSVSLKESRFVDLINKKFTGEIRKEDHYEHYLNIDELKCGVKDGDIYWANVDLTIDGASILSKKEEFDEIPKAILKGWRLPKSSEVSTAFSPELYNLYLMQKNENDENFFMLHKNGDLTFNRTLGSKFWLKFFKVRLVRTDKI